MANSFALIFFKLASIAFFFYTDNMLPNLKVNEVPVLMQQI